MPDDLPTRFGRKEFNLKVLIKNSVFRTPDVNFQESLRVPAATGVRSLTASSVCDCGVTGDVLSRNRRISSRTCPHGMDEVNAVFFFNSSSTSATLPV